MSDRALYPSHPSTSTGDLEARLVAIGLEQPDARRMLDHYIPRQVADVLDALDRLPPGTVRDPARWATDVLRQGRDPAEILAGHRRTRALDREWQRQAAQRASAEEAADRRFDHVERWADAVSSALDDPLLATAVERVTAPVGGFDRRSVPVCVAQLVRWAAAVHDRDPERPLHEALDHALAQDVDQHAIRTEFEEPLPPVPASTRRQPPDHLGDRVAQLTELRVRRCLRECGMVRIRRVGSSLDRVPEREVRRDRLRHVLVVGGRRGGRGSGWVGFGQLYRRRRLVRRCRLSTVAGGESQGPDQQTNRES